MSWTMGVASSSLAASLASVLLVGCASTSSGGNSALPTRSPASVAATPSAASSSEQLSPTPYERAVLADGPLALWPLRQLPTRMVRGDEAVDLVGRFGPATNVDGLVEPTSGPPRIGTEGASFRNSGRLVTPLTSGLSSTDAFTVEMWFRADGCTESWGRVVGSEVAGVGGREGFNVFHYPVDAGQACRVGAEIWQAGRFLVGCPEGAPAPLGVWQHLAVTWAGGRLSCYVDGVLVGAQSVRTANFRQAGPFGIGATGSGSGGTLGAGSIAEVAVFPRALTREQLRRRLVPAAAGASATIKPAALPAEPTS